MSAREVVTIQDIAEALHVSAATVSRALNGSELVSQEMRTKVVQVAGKLKYQRNFLASGLRSQKSQLLGAVVTQLNSTIASCVVAGAEATASQLGYGILLNQSMNKPDFRQSSLDKLRNFHVEGILITSTYFQEYSSLPEFAKLRTPLVVIESSSFLPSHPKKKAKDFDNAFELTNHLIEKGCRRIAYLSVDLEKTRNINLLSGYRKALQQSEIVEADKFIINSHDAENSWGDVCEILISMVPRPDGIIFSNNALTAIAFSPSGATDNPRDEYWLTCRKSNPAVQARILVELGKLAAGLLIGFSKSRATLP